MKSCWTLYTNAKSVQNTEVLLNKVRKYLPFDPIEVSVDGDRYSGHCLTFQLQHGDINRDEFIYQLLSHGELIANSWTLAAVTKNAKGWSTRSRIAGIQQIEWCEI
ncbi:MAG: hypothetical protein OQK12_13220 [Motiliproteus sp.]|nr:hypothetical protein [Motiliproteus sp.]MCW9051073.1 hypothetical protein [Motiliproteus sp.]